jgi:hypothetical protein
MRPDLLRLGWLATLLLGACERWGYDPHFTDDADPQTICETQPCSTRTFGENSTDSDQGVTRDTAVELSAPSMNYGGRAYFQVSNAKTGLLRFDLSAIPANAIVVDATLSLRLTVNDSVDVFTLHPVLEDWTEGQGTTGSVAAASWDERTSGVAWTTDGCDAPGSRSTDAVGTFTLDQKDTTVPIEVATSLVQDWVSGATPNYGFAMTANGADAAAPRTHESSDGERPSLAVTYYEP